MNILLCLQKQRSPNECKYLSVFLVVCLLLSSQSITFQKNCALFIFALLLVERAKQVLSSHEVKEVTCLNDKFTFDILQSFCFNSI